MKSARAFVLFAAAALLLTGCSPATTTAGGSHAAAKSAAPKPTPTIDPGPVALTKEQAGERYLDLICQQNTATLRVNAAFDEKREEYLNGGAPDVSAVKAAAAESLRINRITVELIDDDYYTWPDGTGPLLQKIKGALLGEAGLYSAIANASSYDAAYNATASGDDGGNASQELRYKLGLAADTTGSCVGHEAAAEPLHAEMTKRNDYLASFKKSAK